MKFSEQWLRQWVNPAVSTNELVEKITMAGLEVDGVEAAAGGFSGVVVGEILSAEQHPDADKLRVCQVSNGSETFQVVCGAPNARAGIKIPFAMVGAKLPGDFKIKKAKLRGVESFGMLCAETELAIGDDDSGLAELPLDAPVGEDLRAYLNLDDAIVDVDLTPNRGDCLSIAGLAREVSANFRVAASPLEVADVAAVTDAAFPVEVQDAAGCPRYVGRVINKVNVAASSPRWLVERLRRSGIRSIDPVVDITNYVMLELGQPMHGFDLAELNEKIIVRQADAGELLVLLDGQEVTLSAGTLVIADAKGPLAIAGVMGGEHSGVSSKTQDIFLESAFFDPICIAGKARNYGLHTDSSHRFERGVDYALQRKAIERATALVLEICGGEPGPVVEVVSEENLPEAHEVLLRSERITQVLGMAISDADVQELLSLLGLSLQAEGAGQWRVQVPSWRFDISIEVDLIEELGRIYGYDRLPTSTPLVRMNLKPAPEALTPVMQLRRILVARGYNETVNYSFIDPKLQQQFAPGEPVVELANPISADMAVMRTSLLPGLVKTAVYNQNRQQQRIRLFETGQTFVQKGDQLQQNEQLAMLCYGARDPEGWAGRKEAVDFFDLKGDLERLLEAGGNGDSFSFAAAKHPALHPGQCAAITRNGETIGFIGALHPSLQKTLGLNQPVYLAEVDLAAITEGAVAAFAPLSKYPEVRRDLAVLVKADVAADDLLAAITEVAGELLRDIKLFDVYAGKGIEPGFKSLALGLTLQHASRTLTDDEVNSLFDQVVSTLETRFNAQLRK